MLEHTYYSVISPEGCAVDSGKAANTPPKRPPLSSSPAAICCASASPTRSSPSHPEVRRDHREAASNLKSFLLRNLRELKSVPLDDLVDRRYQKYRKIGVFVESIAAGELLDEPQLNGKAETMV